MAIDTAAMIVSLQTPNGARLRGLLGLLALALCLLAGVSVSQSHQARARSVALDEMVLPAIKQVHKLQIQVDELRGMAALHLLLRSEGQRADLDRRLRAGREAVERQMASYGKRLVDDTDRRHHQAVQAGLADFWVAQDRLLAASRRAPVEPAAAAQARALLTGESQQAYERLRAELDAWWAYTEQWAAQTARRAGAAAYLGLLSAWVSLGAAASALVLVAVATALRRRPLSQPRAVSARRAVDASALQQHLASLNAAVAAARRGEPGRAAGLSAQEAQCLADQVDAATRGLRQLIDLPTAQRQPADGAPR